MFWYTSLIAEGVPSVRTLSVIEEYQTRSGKEKKKLVRRLIVENTPGGGREVTGDWELSHDDQMLLHRALKEQAAATFY